MAAPGDLDSSFGTAGTVITPIGAGDDRAHAVAIDGSGRIIVAGAAANGSDDDFTLARYDTTGTLDPGFGTGGIVTTPIGPADDVAHAVTVDGGGGILVAGTSANGLGQMLFTLARYDATGVLDPLFGTGGIVTTAFGPGDAEARAIAIDGSGRIVLAGTATAGGDADYALARYDASGIPDAGFGSGGTVTTGFGASSDDHAHALAIDGSGRLVVAGSSGTGMPVNPDFSLARYDDTGALDGAFGSGGTVTVAVGADGDVLHAVAIDGSDRIVAAGWSHDAVTLDDVVVARLDATGVLDPAFGAGGVATSAQPGDDTGATLVLEPSGRIVVAGAAGGDAVLAAFTAAGALDAGFGSAGVVTTAIGSFDDAARAAVLDASGRIVVAGTAGNGTDLDVGVARYVDGCGDGELDAGEQCDDGNLASGDCCSSSCAFESSGSSCADDGVACTVDACDGAGTCAHTPDDALCDDGSLCSSDVCDGAGCVHAPANAGSTCRASTGACDPAEACDGVDTACPSDLLEPNGTTCRAAADECDVAEACDGVSVSCPADDVASLGTACTDDGETCTIDVCDGTGTACTHPAGNAGATCRATAGICDVAETCDGTATTCPADAFAPSSTECRAAAGECDLAESCTGSGAACPTDDVKPASTACTDDGETCTIDVCDGTGTACTHPAGNAGATCRATAGICDVAETCDGTATTCPADAFAPSSTECRTTAGECDLAESCTGSGAACPADDVKPASTACTDDGETCTIDVCDGTGTACTHPAGNAGATCRATNGICDVGETCDGTATTCPPDAFEPASFTCRASGGECDVAESCTGSGVACPADAFVPASTACTDDGELCTSDVCSGSSAACTHPAGNAGTLCRAAADICDVSESCDGTGTTCPADAFRPASFTCRNAVGECDLAESCTGSGAACPANGFATAGTACTDDGSTCTTDTCNGSGTCIHPAGNAGAICRAATDVCDVAETCNGSSTTCPANGFRASSFTCRAATGECDVAEHCTGIGPACPADLFTAPSTACTEDGNPCTSDRCDGSGACTHPPGNAGVACRASGSACDVAEACDGASVTCPADTGEPDSDGDSVCDAQDACTNTGGGQDFKPRPKPKIALKRINDNVIPGDDVLSIQGTFDLGVGQSFDEIDPALTGVRILLLNASGGVELDAPLPGGTYHGAGTRGWTTNGSRTKWQYADKTSDGTLTGTYGGIYQVKLQDRSRRTPREVQVKVSGRFATYPVLAGDSPVRAVVVFGGQSAAIAGLCGESSFLASDCRFNGLGTALDCRK